jgi:hypothetical protein
MPSQRKQPTAAGLSLMRWLHVLLGVLFVFGLNVRDAGADQSKIQQNSVDLKKDPFFGRPVTELELILINLTAKAQESASFVAERKELHILNKIGYRTEGYAGFDPGSGRVILVLSLYVTEMADPWREVCDSALGSFYGWFHFPVKEIDAPARLALMGKYFGQAIRIDAERAGDSIDVMIRSIVARANFIVANANSPGLKWSRSCVKDNLTDQTFYTEYRYK